MPRVLMITTAADADKVLHAGSVVNVSAKEAKDLIAGGHARELAPGETAAQAASEQATGRRGASKAVSGPEDQA